MKKGNMKNLPWTIFVIVLFVGLITASGFYSAAFTMTNKDTLPEGITIDGIDVGGMTREEAEHKVVAQFESKAANGIITVYCGAYAHSFSQLDAGAKLDLTEAFAEIAARMQGSTMEQLDSRLALKQGFAVNSKVTYDKQLLMEEMERFAQEIELAPVDATVVFEEGGAFSFSNETPGRMLDRDALCGLLLERLNKEDYSDIQVSLHTVMPEMTREMLKEHTVKLGTATTTVAGSSERITNVFLITEIANGVMIRPGEELSLNTLTGERTPEKGYQEAPAIRYGELIEEIGGGICQLSGTLYLAALLSDLEITERHHHSWPSDYLPIGLDATITWPGKDLKIRNNTAWPVYIHAAVKEDQLTVTLYGERQTDYEIQVVNDIYETIKPPAAEMEYDNTRPTSYKRTLQKEREGYRVKVYRNYYQDGSLVRSELISNDHFAAFAGKYVVGTKVISTPPKNNDK